MVNLTPISQRHVLSSLSCNTNSIIWGSDETSVSGMINLGLPHWNVDQAEMTFGCGEGAGSSSMSQWVRAETETGLPPTLGPSA